MKAETRDSPRAVREIPARVKGALVVPVYNEEQVLQAFYETCAEAADGIFDEWEMVLVDDGSTDRTAEIVRGLNSRDGRVKAVRLARNFGSHTAIAAGLDQASGDIAVVLAADLQDPPYVVAEMVAKWREGYDVVWATRGQRDERFVRRTVARIFYWLVRKIALPSYPKTGTGSFCLLDERVVEAVRTFPERNRMTFGIVSWTGFSQADVSYRRPKRRAGKSHWTFRQQVKAAVDTLVSFSYVPIRLVSLLGLIASLVGFAAAVYLVIASIAFGVGVVGWPSTIVTILVLGGLQLLTLGVLGEYIWRIAEEVKRRPLYLVSERIGFGGAEPHGDNRA